MEIYADPFDGRAYIKKFVSLYILFSLFALLEKT